MAREFQISFNIFGRVQSAFSQAFTTASDRMSRLNTNASSLKAELSELDSQHRKTTLTADRYAATQAKLSSQIDKVKASQEAYIAKSQLMQDKAGQMQGKAAALENALRNLAERYKSGALTTEQYSSAHAKLLTQLTNTKAAQERYGTQVLALQGKINQTKSSMDSLGNKMRDLDSRHKKGLEETERHAAAYSKLTAQLNKAQKAQQDYQKATAMQDKARASRDTARNAMAGTIETAVVVTGPVYASMEFESAMGGVAKQVEGARSATGELTGIFYEVQGRVLQASKDMMIMPEAMAKAFTMAAKSGVQGMENIDKFARMGMMMGTAFEAPAEEITEHFAKIGSAMGINLATAEGIARLEALADTVNYLDDQSNASGADIISVLKRISGTATSLIPTLSDKTLAGMSTAMLQMGETAETSGTALNALFTKIAAAPTQSKTFKAALEQIGMTAEELQAGALQDGETAIMNLFERIGQLDGATKNNVLAELFGAEHIDTLSKISGNYEQFIEIIKKGNSEAAKGSMAREFEIQAQSTSRQLEGLKASMARVSIELTAALLPHIKTLTGWLSTGAEWIANFSQENKGLSSALVTTGAVVLGGAVALSSLAWAGWAVIAPFVGLYGWLSQLIIAQNAAAVASGRLTIAQRLLAGAQWIWNASLMGCPVVWIVAGIAAIVAAGYLLYKNWDMIKAKTIEVWSTVVTWFSNAYDATAKFIDDIGSSLGTTWTAIVTWFDNAYQVASEFISQLPNRIAYGIGYAIGFIATLPERAAVLFQNMYTTTNQWISAMILSVISWLASLPDRAQSTFDLFISKATQWTTNVYNTVTQWIKNTVEAAIESITSLPDRSVTAFDTFLTNATQWAMNVYTTVVDWFMQIPNKIMEAFNQAASFLDGLRNKVANFTTGLSVSFSAGIAEGSGGAVQVASNATGGIYNKGAFLTTFAEKSAEAAIPLDGSPRAISLWQQAGEILGVSSTGNMRTGRETATANSSPRAISLWQQAEELLGVNPPDSGGINVTFAPVINATGGNAQEIREMLQAAEDDLIGKLEALQRQQRRISYA